MPSVYVYHEELNALLFAVKHFPEATPNRWELISELIRSQNVESTSPKVCLDQSLRGAHNITVYDLKNRENCKLVYRLISNKYPSLLHVNIAEALFKRSGKTAFKPIVLIPCRTECCGSKIKVDNRPSFPLVYTTKGTYVAALFHGQCAKCKTTWYPSYKITSDNRRIFTDLTGTDDEGYLQITCQTVFEKKLLNDVSTNLWVSGTTFNSRAKVYNVNFRETDEKRLCEMMEFTRTSEGEWHLNEQRIADAWFIWIIIKYYSQIQKLEEISFKISFVSKRLDIEHICELMWKEICSRPNKWVQHSCKTPGCSEGYITVDGNEYLKRSKCALPATKVKIRKDLPPIFQCCTNSPQPGGKSQEPSKFCEMHMKESQEAEELSVPPEFNVDKCEVGLLPEQVCLEDAPSLGCKRRNKKSQFFETTAGMLALIRPCGIVVNMTEMFTSESLTQVFLFILRTFSRDIADIGRLKYLGYDRACALVPYLRNQAKNGSAGAKLLLQHVKFLVDIFHVSKHTEAVCMPPDNPKCQFHPHLSQFSKIKVVNTESCEQGFRRLNQYFEITRKMTQYKRDILFWFVNDSFNSDLEKKLKTRKLM